jgi:hypothetical protein
MTSKLKDALEFAVTGNPVPFYWSLITDFLRHFHSDDFGDFSLRRLSAIDLLLYQRGNHILLLNGWDYTRRERESQEGQYDARWLFQGQENLNANSA